VDEGALAIYAERMEKCDDCPWPARCDLNERCARSGLVWEDTHSKSERLITPLSKDWERRTRRSKPAVPWLRRLLRR